MRNLLCLVTSSALTLLAACSAVTDTVSNEYIGDRTLAIEGSNALNLNALNLNALNLNALNLNALDAGMLAPDSLGALQDPSSRGDLARQFVRYAVNCALDATQTFSFSWTDSTGVVHQESYPGNLALAPYWASHSLNAGDELWISACLASRVNWYGVPVLLSARGPSNALPVSLLEAVTFTIQEGAFFGNLFGSTPKVYSCYNTANVNLSRSHERDCAAGHLNADGSVSDCGIIQRIGPCSSFCTAVSEKDGSYPSCMDPQGLTYSKLITIFLE